jgi:predicted porin
MPMALLSTSAIYADSSNFCIKDISPFIGADIGRSRVEMKKDFGEKIFRKNATFYNLFAGLDFNEYFGVEFGYQRDNTRRDKQSLVTGDVIMGLSPVHAAFSPEDYDTFLRIKNKYFGITAQYPIAENLSLTVLFAPTKTQVKAGHTFIAFNGTPIPQVDIDDFLYARTYKKSKIVPMVRVGAKYKFHERLAFRANVTWMGTSRIKINSDQNGQSLNRNRS